MKLGIDEYSKLDSPLHRWEPRCKLIGLMVLIFAFSYIQDLRMLLAMLLVTAVIYITSGLPVSFLLGRLRYPSFFLLVVILTLPFLSGETTVMSIGPLDLREEGLLSVVLIATRFLSILTIGLVLFSTAPFLTTIKAMRALGLPAILADMVLLSFRYLHEIGGNLQQMQTSMRLRGFRRNHFSTRSFRVLAWLSGSILVRSYERSEWVYKAMTLRGYGHASPPRDEFQAHPNDIIALGVFILIATGFVVGDIICGHDTASLLQ
ncbi:cobalt ECF transporter T component CbiQ [Chloroflexota bacterium]